MEIITYVVCMYKQPCFNKSDSFTEREVLRDLGTRPAAAGRRAVLLRL